MSQEVNMKLNVDSKQAQKNVGAVNEKLKETSKESKKVSTDVSEMGISLTMSQEVQFLASRDL